MEQNDAALGQPTTQEGGAEAALGDGSKLESDYPSASDKTQQQSNAVVHGEEVEEANETAAGSQKKETLTVIPPTPIENQRLNTGKFLLTRDSKKGLDTKKKKGLVPKRKRAREDSDPVTKRGSRHG